MYKIGIVGYGYVGRGIGDLFGNKVQAVYDPAVGYSNMGDFKKVDLAVICVMTKENKDGSCDVSIVESSIKWLVEIKKDILILVKSAIPPLQIEKLLYKYDARIVVSPEYLGESKYFTPFWRFPDPSHMKYHDFQIFGGHKKDTSECVDIFQSVMGPTVKYYQTNLKTAALCKYMENSFFAMKVTFCNEWYEIAKAHGVDYNELREIWTADPRVGQMHTSVFPKKRGYGGKCFPKDTKAIIKESEELGYKPELMKSMDKINKNFVKQNEQ